MLSEKSIDRPLSTLSNEVALARHLKGSKCWLSRIYPYFPQLLNTGERVAVTQVSTAFNQEAGGSKVGDENVGVVGTSFGFSVL